MAVQEAITMSAVEAVTAVAAAVATTITTTTAVETDLILGATVARLQAV